MRPLPTIARPDWSAVWRDTIAEGIGAWCGPWDVTRHEARAAVEWVRHNVPSHLLGYKTTGEGVFFTALELTK